MKNRHGRICNRADVLPEYTTYATSRSVILMRITEFAEKHNMFPREGKVLCALSGGRDSMCLLHILLELAPEYGFSVACAHYNHRLRGGESDRDARFVKEYCARLGIPVYVGSGDVAALPGKRAGRGGGGQKTALCFS